MTDIEQKALALVREVLAERNISAETVVGRKASSYVEAFCRAIEQHEAFRQEVSQRAKKVLDVAQTVNGYANAREAIECELSSLVIAKPDPLVDSMREACGAQGLATKHTPGELTERLRAAIEKRGGKIVWGEG